MVAETRVLLTPRRVLIACLTITGALLLAHLAALFVMHGMGRDHAFGLVPLFDVNRESNAPTLFSSILLLSIGGALVAAGLAERRFRAASGCSRASPCFWR